MYEIKNRFRGFLPVVVDVETGGFDNQKDALLEVAAIIIKQDSEGFLYGDQVNTVYVEPFEGANIDPKSLEITGIDLDHPLRQSMSENQALGKIFSPIRKALKETECNRAILVGHNAHFDLGFINSASNRAGIKRNPFHPFSCLDTVTLSALAYGQTVLARAIKEAEISWDNERAHSAMYDTEKTSELFCKIHNKWHELSNINK